jgi:excisionase family DNA binding protein
MTELDRTQSRRKRLFTIREAGEYLGRTPWAVRHLIWDGLLPSVRIGRRVQVDVRDMDDMIERNKGVER